MDGSETKESLNGTWFSINTAENQFNRKESDKFLLSHGDDFRINNFIFKVEELNINKFIKSQKKTKALLKSIVTPQMR